MRESDAATLIRQWWRDYGHTVRRTLNFYGVATEEDRAECKQEVFITAFKALVSGASIENPRAWLRECSRKHASNFRAKARRKGISPTLIENVDRLSPEQIADDREMLYIALESLDEERQDIVLAMSLEGASYEEIARERGISIDRMRYLHNSARQQMELALKRANTRSFKRRFLTLPLLLARLFDALWTEACPALDRRARAGLESFLASAVPTEPEPESERVSFVQPALSMQSTPPHARLWAVRPAFEVTRWGSSSAIALGLLLLGASLREPSPEPRSAQSTPPLALNELAKPLRDAGATLPAAPASEPDAAPGGLPPREPRSARGAFASAPLDAAPSMGSQHLLDRARAHAAFQPDGLHLALELLALHARRFPGNEVADRRSVLRIICGARAARGAPECASLLASSAAR
jgi:RNA polymerase sigma factor (sigma-70 family)